MRALAAVIAIASGLGVTTALGSRDVVPTLFGTKGAIATIAADGSRVALTTSGIAGSCDRVVVWNAVKKTFVAFKTNIHCPGGSTSGGQSLREIALAGTRVAWVERAAGNLEDLTFRTAAITGPKISNVAFAENQSGAEGGVDGDYLGNLAGDGTLIAFNTWSRCTVLPPGAVDELAELCAEQPVVAVETHPFVNQRLWTLVLGKKTGVAAGAASLDVVSVDAGRIAVQQPGGPVTIFSAAGAVIRTIAVPAGTFAGTALSGARLATLRDGTLEVYATGTGAKTASIPVAGKAVLRDLQAGFAVVVAGLDVRVIRIADGKQMTIHTPGAGPVDAQLEATGLFYSYNLPKSTAKGRVAFVPLATVKASIG